MLLNKFKLKNWYNYTPAKRQTILQKLENKMARRAGRPSMPISIVTNEDWNCFGSFEFKNGKAMLHLNILLITNPNLRFQAMATVLHEGRHYTQHYASSSDLSWFEFRAKKWRKNIQKYVPSAVDQDLYRMQVVERDAQKFAIKQLRKWKNKFDDEDDFWLVFNNLTYRYSEAEKEAQQKYGKNYKRKINKKIDNL